VRKFLLSLLAVTLICGLSVTLIGCGGNKSGTTKATGADSGGKTEKTEKKGT
jgi:hypothetical protein